MTDTKKETVGAHESQTFIFHCHCKLSNSSIKLHVPTKVCKYPHLGLLQNIKSELEERSVFCVHSEIIGGTSKLITEKMKIGVMVQATGGRWGQKEL